jgi:hypothetical protein
VIAIPLASWRGPRDATKSTPPPIPASAFPRGRCG